MGFQNHITAGFLALAQALPASAQDATGPYAVSRECAIRVLNETFTSAVDIIEAEGGVGSIFSTDKATVSTLVVINPDNGIVSSIDTQLDSIDPAFDYSTKALLSYESGSQSVSFVSYKTAKALDDTALSVARNIDGRLRRCAGEMLLGNVQAPSPFKLG